MRIVLVSAAIAAVLGIAVIAEAVLLSAPYRTQVCPAAVQAEPWTPLQAHLRANPHGVQQDTPTE